MLTWHWGLATAIIAAALINEPTLHDPFHGDDFVAFRDFGRKPSLPYLEDVILFRDTNFYWRPLGTAFHFMLFEIGGLNPFVFRLAGLLVFLLTLAGLYAFCLREKLGRCVALGAVALFGLFPNHVVSVAWVTNTSRLMAVLFLILALLALQRRRGRLAPAHEVVAWLCFMAAVLCDETSLALAPVPFVYATFLSRDRLHWRAAAARLALYALPVILLLPLQFQYTLNDEPRLAMYGLGAHVPTQFWALASQLVLPLTETSPLDIFLHRIPPAQWAAGLVAIVAGGLLLVVGSWQLRFLVLWTGLALSPFALWGVNYTSPRYVFMAALPYAIVFSWALSTVGSRILGAVPAFSLPRGIVLGAARALAAGAVAAAAFISGQTVLERNQAWSAQVGSYGVLAEELRQALPSVPENSRLIIYYSPWPDFWATSVVQSIYEDRTLRVISVRRNWVDSGLPFRRPNDIVVFYTGEEFISLTPPAQTTRAQ